MTTARVALIAGSTGIVGGNLAALLVEQGWTVYGLARRPSSAAGVLPVAADLRDRNTLATALADITPTHVFFCTWLRQPTEAENVAVNGEMIENLFAALREKPLQHAGLVTEYVRDTCNFSLQCLMCLSQRGVSVLTVPASPYRAGIAQTI
jgi:nucleoside-diphosphate-sugar epimerase